MGEAKQRRETVKINPNLWYWIAINGPSCALSEMPMNSPVVSPIPEKLIGFPTFGWARRAQKICLTATVEEVSKFLKSLGPAIADGVVRVIQPKKPEPFTRGTTVWQDAAHQDPLPILRE